MYISLLNYHMVVVYCNQFRSPMKFSHHTRSSSPQYKPMPCVQSCERYRYSLGIHTDNTTTSPMMFRKSRQHRKGLKSGTYRWWASGKSIRHVQSVSRTNIIISISSTPTNWWVADATHLLRCDTSRRCRRSKRSTTIHRDSTYRVVRIK